MIRILRGDSAAIAATAEKESAEKTLQAGQPLYNTDKNYLTIGDGSKTVNAQPITVRELRGWWGDRSGIISSNKPDDSSKLADPDFGVFPQYNSNLDLNWFQILGGNRTSINFEKLLTGKSGEQAYGIDLNAQFGPIQLSAFEGNNSISLSKDDNEKYRVRLYCDAVQPYSTAKSIDLGAEDFKFDNIYANNFIGTATTATAATANASLADYDESNKQITLSLFPRLTNIECTTTQLTTVLTNSFVIEVTALKVEHAGTSFNYSIATSGKPEADKSVQCIINNSHSSKQSGIIFVFAKDDTHYTSGDKLTFNYNGFSFSAKTLKLSW